VRIEFYDSPRQLRKLKRAANLIGESTIHIDYVDRLGNATDGQTGRYESGVIPDRPETPEEILLKLLLEKLKNNTITFEQLKTLLRLEHGFELTQTTRDKILIAVQGIVGTLRDRLKSVFGL